MIETALTEIASAVTTVIIPKALEAVGQKVGHTAFEQSGQAIQATRQLVHAKLATAGTASLLQRLEQNPSPANQQVLQAELVSHMEVDRVFAQQLQTLVAHMKPDYPELQSIFDNALIRGELEVGSIDIKNQSQPSGKQVIGKNLKVGRDFCSLIDFRMGDGPLK